jgi:hypothetical protein
MLLFVLDGRANSIDRPSGAAEMLSFTAALPVLQLAFSRSQIEPKESCRS